MENLCEICKHYSYHHDEPTIDEWSDFHDSSGDAFRRVYICGLMESAEAMETDFECRFEPR